MSFAETAARRVPSAPDATNASTAQTVSAIDRLLAWRDRLLANARFQRAAARFAPTRWIARRRARALFDLVAGFTYSQVLLACVRLRVFELLLDRPRTAADIAARVGLTEDRADRLLVAAASLRLVERRSGDRFGLGPLGAPLANGAAITSMIEHHAVLYADLADPVALLEGQSTTALGDVWGYAGSAAPGSLDERRIDAYCALMTQSQPLVADQILDAYSLKRHRRLLDVGGGEGAFAAAAANRHPHLEVAVFDLPAVVARAQGRLSAAGLGGRATTHGGDFLHDALPTGADIASLVRVIHDHDDEHAMRILRAVHAALPAGGVLVLAEPMSGTAGAEPMGDAYFGLYLLAMGSGRPRTRRQLEAMLRAAGFDRIRLVATALPIQTRVLVGRKRSLR